MRKYLIAGPSVAINAKQSERLRSLVWTYICDFMLCEKGVRPGIICAEDTATGRLAKVYAQSLPVPVFAYSAHVINDRFTQDDRDLIAIRNMKMVAEPEIVRAILFTHTGECSDILAGLQAQKSPIEIIRVMG